MFSTHPPSLPSPTLPAMEACLCDCRTGVLDLVSRPSMVCSQTGGSYLLNHHFCRVLASELPLVAHDEKG